MFISIAALTDFCIGALTQVGLSHACPDSWIFDDPSLPSGHNGSFIAIDIGAIVPPKQFEQRLRALIDEIHAAPTAAGIERVLPSGENGACISGPRVRGSTFPQTWSKS